MDLGTLAPPQRAGLPKWIDTHAHLWMTLEAFQQGGYAVKDVFDMAHQLHFAEHVEYLVDIWCEAPVQKERCLHLADADQQLDWRGVDYRFAIGFLPLYASAS